MTLLSMTRGDTATWDIALTDQETGDPVTLTEVFIVFTAKRRVTDIVPVLRKTDGDGITVTNESGGTCTLTIEPEDTEDWTEAECRGSLLWDVSLTDSLGNVRTAASGHLAVIPDVSAGAQS